MNSSHFLFIFDQRNISISLNSHDSILKQTGLLYYESRHTSVMTTQVSCKTYLDAIIISRCQGEDTFVGFQPMGIFCFWRKGIFTIFKGVYSPSIHVFLSPHPLLSQVFRFALASSSLANPFHAVKDQIKIRENRGL